jgi:hypothetical protein
MDWKNIKYIIHKIQIIMIINYPNPFIKKNIVCYQKIKKQTNYI